MPAPPGPPLETDPRGVADPVRAGLRRLVPTLRSLRDGIGARTDRIARIARLLEAGRRMLRRLHTEIEAIDTALTETEAHVRVFAGQSGDMGDALDGLNRDYGAIRAVRTDVSREIGDAAALAKELATAARAIRLLSLTGGVEAARAGAAGQGFAVVAARMQDLGATCEEKADRLVLDFAGIERGMEDIARRGRVVGDELATLPAVAEQLQERGAAAAAFCIAAQADRAHMARRANEMSSALEEARGEMADMRRAGETASRDLKDLVGGCEAVLCAAGAGEDGTWEAAGGAGTRARHDPPADPEAGAPRR